MKTQLGEYIFCALWSVGGLSLALVIQYMPTPEEAAKAFMIGVISATGGLLLRWAWFKLRKAWGALLDRYNL